MIVLSRSPASPSSDHDNGGQTAANPVDLLSQCADAFKLARSAVSEVDSCSRAQVELPRKFHEDFGRFADVYPVNRCAFEEDKAKPVTVEAGWTTVSPRRRSRRSRRQPLPSGTAPVSAPLVASTNRFEVLADVDDTPSTVTEHDDPGESAQASRAAKLSEIDLGCVDLIDLFRVGSKDQSLH